MSKTRGATHLHLDKGHVLSHPSYYKYTCAPLSKLPSCAPVQQNIQVKRKCILLLNLTSYTERLRSQSGQLSSGQCSVYLGHEDTMFYTTLTFKVIQVR